MKLFYKEPMEGIKHYESERSDGFQLPDVYLSAQLEDLISDETQRESLLLQLIDRFKNKDYGKITSFEYVDNMAQRHIFFTNTWMHARYETELGTICLELLYDMALFYPWGENIDALRHTQSEKDKKNGPEGWRV